MLVKLIKNILAKISTNFANKYWMCRGYLQVINRISRNTNWKKHGIVVLIGRTLNKTEKVKQKSDKKMMYIERKMQKWKKKKISN